MTAVAAKLAYHPSGTGSASSSAPSIALPDIPPPPGLVSIDEVASTMMPEDDAEDDVLSIPSSAEELVDSTADADAAPEPSSWWLEAVAGSEAPRYALLSTLTFQPQGRFPWNELTNMVQAHLYRGQGAQMPRWLGGQNSLTMRQHIAVGSPHPDVLLTGSLARAVGMLRS